MKIKIKYLEENKEANVIENINYISIYIFNIIRVKKIKLDRKVHTDNKSKNKINNTIYMIVKQILKSLEKEEIVKIVMDILKNY